jgi:hypothetical protein
METTTPHISAKSDVLPASKRGRGMLGFVGILLPIPCFLFASIFKPEWKGDGGAFAKLLIQPEVASVFYPLLLYSMGSLAALFWSKEHNFWVRLGVYTGTILALQFTIVLMETEGNLIPSLVYLSLGAATLAFWYLIARNWSQNTNAHSPIQTDEAQAEMQADIKQEPFSLSDRKTWFYIGVVALLIVFAILNEKAFVSAISAVSSFAIFGLLLAPFWCLFAYGWTSYCLIRAWEMPHLWEWTHYASIAAWLAAYGVAWRFAFLKAVELYQKLPDEAPDCYIATAATNGHAAVVKSEMVTLTDGNMMRVNPQLQRLKAAEMALKTGFPRLHRLLRKCYDQLGKPLARSIKKPWVADVAYLILKPIEWISCFILRRLIPQFDALTQKIYRNN